MTQEFKTEKGEFLIVKLPDNLVSKYVYMGYLICKVHNIENGVTEEQMEDYNKLQKYLKNHDPDKDYKETYIKLPPFDWEIIGDPFDLTKDQWSLIVDHEELFINGNSEGIRYMDYSLSEKYKDDVCEWFHHPMYSGISLLKSLNIYRTNPLGKREQTHKRHIVTGSWDVAEVRTGKFILLKKS